MNKPVDALPVMSDINKKLADEERLNPLEEFITNYQPYERGEVRRWRRMLQKAMVYGWRHMHDQG